MSTPRLLPPIAEGTPIRVIGGEYKGQTGTVLTANPSERADYFYAVRLVQDRPPALIVQLRRSHLAVIPCPVCMDVRACTCVLCKGEPKCPECGR